MVPTGGVAGMEIRLLGPVELLVDGASVPVAGTKLRAVLAMLALEANRPVSADRLIEGLWGETLPASAGKMVQHYVWQLRRLLPADEGAEIVTRGRGYELRVDPERVDVLRLERLIGDAAQRAGNGAAREALGLWRAAPLADVADHPFAGPEIRRLEELRLDAAELAFESDLAAGNEREVLGEIETLLAQHPLRERLHAQRMLALYRCGRQAEALEAYREARAALVELIGVEPGPELQRLQRAVLRQDADLELEPRSPELPAELDLALATPMVGPRRRARPAADGLGAGAQRQRGAGDARGRARGWARRAWRPNSPPTPLARAPRCSTSPVRAAASRRWPPWLMRAGCAVRRCWSSTTPIARMRRCSPRWLSRRP